MDQEKIFSLGRKYEEGAISYDSLTDMQKFDLSRYFSMKNDFFDDRITQVSNSLTEMDTQLNQVYEELKNM